MRNNPGDTKVSQERERVAPSTRTEFPLKPVWRIMVEQAVPLLTWYTTSEQISTLQPVEDLQQHFVFLSLSC